MGINPLEKYSSSQVFTFLAKTPLRTTKIVPHPPFMMELREFTFVFVKRSFFFSAEIENWAWAVSGRGKKSIMSFPLDTFLNPP